jgi:hypothetical protein
MPNHLGFCAGCAGVLERARRVCVPIFFDSPENASRKARPCFHALRRPASLLREERAGKLCNSSR